MDQQQNKNNSIKKNTQDQIQPMDDSQINAQKKQDEPTQVSENNQIDVQYAQEAPDTTIEQTSTVKEQQIPNKFSKIKRFFFQVLIACLVASAGVAITAVLMGSFNEVLGRSLGTIGMVAVHALLSFSYISGAEKRSTNDDSEKSLDIFSNIVFGLIAASFITSILAIWLILSGDLTARLYMLYGVLLLATLFADAVYRLKNLDSKIDTLIVLNYIFMVVVVVMLSIMIFVPELSYLDEIFYRILAASGIVYATTTLMVTIMHKMYLQKHPKLQNSNSSTDTEASDSKKNIWKNPFIIILLIFIVLNVIPLLTFLLIGVFSK